MSVKTEYDYGRQAWTFKADVPFEDGSADIYRSPALFTSEAQAQHAGEVGLEMASLEQRSIDDAYQSGRRLIVEEIRDEYGTDLNKAIRFIRDGLRSATAYDVDPNDEADAVVRSLALLCEFCEIPVEPDEPEAMRNHPEWLDEWPETSEGSEE